MFMKQMKDLSVHLDMNGKKKKRSFKNESSIV